MTWVNSLTEGVLSQCHYCTVPAAYTGELGTGHFLRYKRKSGLSDYGLSGGHCISFLFLLGSAFVTVDILLEISLIFFTW